VLGGIRDLGGLVVTALLAHWFFWFTGARNESGTAYGLLSGAGGAIPDVMLPAGALAWWWHHTCHDSPRCLRWGRYPVAGGLFKTCARHHPDLQGQRPRRELIHRMHREHLERTSR
jgi:hypothetical protein